MTLLYLLLGFISIDGALLGFSTIFDSSKNASSIIGGLSEFVVFSILAIFLHKLAFKSNNKKGEKIVNAKYPNGMSWDGSWSFDNQSFSGQIRIDKSLNTLEFKLGSLKSNIPLSSIINVKFPISTYLMYGTLYLDNGQKLIISGDKTIGDTEARKKFLYLHIFLGYFAVFIIRFFSKDPTTLVNITNFNEHLYFSLRSAGIRKKTMSIVSPTLRAGLLMLYALPITFISTILVIYLIVDLVN